MKTNFEFIDARKHDKSTKKLARSHAMKGKNVGKKHHRGSKLSTEQQAEKGQSSLVKASREQKSEEPIEILRNTALDMTYETIGSQLLSISFPVGSTLLARETVHQFFTLVLNSLFPPQLCSSLEYVKSYWLQVLFMDKTSYHCSLALMSTYNDFFFGQAAVSSKGVYHLNQAVSLVNQKLQTSEALSNSNLAVVNFLIEQELLRESQWTAEVHLNGLQRMIELRGGLSELEKDGLLALKICKTDLDYAFHYGTSTCFYRDRMLDVISNLASQGFYLTEDVALFHPSFNGINPFLRQIMLDVTNISWLFNMDYPGMKVDPPLLQEIIVSAGYRLVRFHALCSSPLHNRLESACHIGLVTFITTLFIRFGRRRFLKYSLIAEHLKKAIDSGLDLQNQDLLLWLLFVGGVSVLAEEDAGWLFSRIHMVTQSLGIKDWTDIRQLLVNFPWINSIHDDAGKELWELVRSRDNPVFKP